MATSPTSSGPTPLFSSPKPGFGPDDKFNFSLAQTPFLERRGEVKRQQRKESSALTGSPATSPGKLACYRAESWSLINSQVVLSGRAPSAKLEQAGCSQTPVFPDDWFLDKMLIVVPGTYRILSPNCCRSMRSFGRPVTWHTTACKQHMARLQWIAYVL